jgi:UDP-glucuronate 4-epimerase
VPITYADVRKSEALLGYRPQIDIATGIKRFATWFQTYYRD